MRTTTIRAPLAAACLAVATAAVGAPQQDDIAELSLEQLSDIVITSVSRQEERLANAAASIYIIGNADIRRSGARSLPEALRLAPNLQVARIDARSYAITARGFAARESNKLLVLIDGRSVYTPLFSGVHWDMQDVPLEDIDRIEVISGPGASIWGVNAVNGVINVITRSAKDTQGTLLTVAGGKDDRDGTARHGGAFANGGHYRLYARFAEADDAKEEGRTTASGMRRRQAGFRADWDAENGGFTLSGDVYRGTLEQSALGDIVISGTNAIARYTRRLSDDANVRVQLVLDHTLRDQPAAVLERLDTVDLEAQHSLRLGERHNFTWGGSYRWSNDRLTNGRAFAFLPAQVVLHWAALFAQDEVALLPDLRLTVGGKIEHNHYTGAEYLPSARLAWTPDSRQLVWGALSRTVRAPSRVDRDLFAPIKPFPFGGSLRYSTGGGPDFESETANVAELGYRVQPAPRWTYSATAFFADYDRLRTTETNLKGPPLTGLTETRNMGYGTTRGVEMWARWQVTDNWRLNGGLVVQRIRTGLRPGSTDPSGKFGLATLDPGHYWQLRSSHDLPGDMQLDWTLRYVGALQRPEVPSYHELDVQWLWRLTPHVDVALVGQNLLHPSHAEFGTGTTRSVFDRSATLKLTVRF